MWRRPIVIALLLAAAGCGLWMDDEARYERATRAFTDGDYQAAVIDLRNILQRSPDDVRARVLLGRALAAAADYEAAAKEFQAALDLGHPVDGLRAELAETWIATGQPERALDVADPGLAEYVDEAFRLRLLRGDALAAMGETLGALREYDEADGMEGATNDALRHAAEIHWGEGHLADARFLMELALVRDPADADARLTLAGVLLDAGQPATALGVLADAPDAARGDPDTEAWFQLFELRAKLAAGDTAGAREALDRIARIWDRSEPELVLATAEVALAEGDDGEAARAAQAYLALDEDSATAMRILGAAQLGRGLVQQAEDWLQAALREDPDRADTLRLLGRVFLRLGEPESARDYLGLAFDLDPTDAWTAAMLGVLAATPDPVGDALVQGDTAAALAAAAAGVDEMPGDARAWQRLGLSQLAAGRVDEAAASLGRALSYAPGEPAVRIDLARTELARSNPAAAIAILDPAPAVIGDDYELTMQAALSRRFADGVADQVDLDRLVRWIAARPDNVESRLILAREVLEVGDYSGAATRYRALIDDGYLSPEIYNNLAWSYLQTGDPRARTLAETALELAPEDGAVLDTLGWIMASAGRHDAALPLLRDAALLRPGDAEIATHLATTLSRTGREESAVATLSRFRDTGKETADMRNLWDDLSQNQ